MGDDDLDATLLSAALGEELQMADIYSQMMQITKSEDVKRVLGLLVSESREHASTVSDLLLELSSKYSWELEDIDKKVAEGTAKTVDFKLSSDAIAWYREKLSGLTEESMEEAIENIDTTKQATVFALDIFVGSERTAYNLYDILSRKLTGQSKSIITKIKEDELRHANMLNELIWRLKTGKKSESPKPLAKPTDASHILYCAVCNRLSSAGLSECDVCGEELKEP